MTQYDFDLDCCRYDDYSDDSARADALPRRGHALSQGITCICSSCTLSKPAHEFSRKQLMKGPTKQRCKGCVDSTAVSQLMAAVSLSTPHESPTGAACSEAPATNDASQELELLRTCKECHFMGVGRVDTRDDRFYCEYCWSVYEGRRWSIIGQSSTQFTSRRYAPRAPLGD